MNAHWRRRLSLRNWPIAWKMALAMLAIFLAAQAIIFLVSDVLVRRSLIQGEEMELFERTIERARLVQELRDELLLSLHTISWQHSDTLLGSDPQASQELLREKLFQMGQFYDLSLLDGEGRVTVTTSPALEGEDLASAPWLGEAERHMAGVSHLQEFADRAALGFILYVPVPDEDAETGYSPLTLIGRLPATAIWKLVDPVQVRESGYAYMADENAVLIAHGARASTGQRTHALVLQAIGEENDPPVVEANAQNLYGQPTAGWLNLTTLADFIQEGVATPTEDPTPNVHRYFFTERWKTSVVVPVGELQVQIPNEIEATDWVLGITVLDDDFLAPLRHLRQGLLAATGAGILAAFVAALIYSRTITEPIRQLAVLVAHVERGAYDERVTLTQEDELGRLAGGLNTMLDRLAEAMATQRRQLETLLHTSDTVRRDAETISSSAEEQAAATEELDASADEVTKTVQKMAQDAAEQMNQVQRTAEEMQALDREIAHIASLSQQMSDASERMRSLAEQTEQDVAAARENSRRVGAVVKTIEKFGRQTNMLALNATIEAARAGEIGESFTVVADEVRRMAENSRQALVEVDALNKAIQQGMGEISEAMGRTKDAIVDVSTLIEQVVQTAARQTNASRAIVEVVNQLASIAENNAAGSEEMAAVVEEQSAAFGQLSESSQELAGLALRLQTLARQLTPEEEGHD